MKLITNQLTLVKKSYKKNIFLGLAHSTFFAFICVVFAPELLLVFGPITIFNKVKSMETSMLNKIVILFVSYVILGFVIYNLFFLVKKLIFKL